MSVECPLASSLVLPSLLLSYFLTSDDWDWNPQRHLGKWDDSDGLGTSTETLGGSVASRPEAGVLVSRGMSAREGREREKPKTSKTLMDYLCFSCQNSICFRVLRRRAGKRKPKIVTKQSGRHTDFAHTLSGRVWVLVCASAAELGMDIESSVAIRHRMMIIARTDTSLNTTLFLY